MNWHSTARRNPHQMEVLALAEHVFGSNEAALRWLNEEHPLLDGQAPIRLAEQEAGAARVARVLRNIEFGLPV